MDGDARIGGYDFKATEELVLSYWENQKIYKKSIAKNKKGKIPSWNA